MRKVAVVGVGLHPYGRWGDREPAELARVAVEGALEGAGLPWSGVQSAWCGQTSLGITAGARLLAPLGRTGLSITNVENASATGSYAFRGAWLEVASGEFDVALALGVDRITAPGSGAGLAAALARGSGGNDLGATLPSGGLMQKFAEDARAHMQKYGTTIDQLAQVSVKQHWNAARNPDAQYRKEVTLEEVHAARMVADPLTVLHCCPFGDGAAAAILASEEVVARLGIEAPVWVAASVSASTRAEHPELAALTAHTARQAYERAGLGPEELGMVEIHDAATIEEILYVESLGLCAEGEGGPFVERGETAITGRIPVNSSGGLLAMGHPFGPTGLGQIAEIYRQLRGEAGERQIPGRPRNGLAHMVGLGGVCIVHVLTR